MDRGPAHDVGQVRQRRAAGLVVRPVAADRLQQRVPLGLPRRDALALGLPVDVVGAAPLILVGVYRAGMARARKLRRALRPVDKGGEFRVALGQVADHVVGLGTVGKVHSIEKESRFWLQSGRSAARPPMPCAATGQASLIQQISSIWWMSISANSPPKPNRTW